MRKNWLIKKINFVFEIPRDFTGIIGWDSGKPAGEQIGKLYRLNTPIGYIKGAKYWYCCRFHFLRKNVEFYGKMYGVHFVHFLNNIIYYSLNQ